MFLSHKARRRARLLIVAGGVAHAAWAQTDPVCERPGACSDPVIGEWDGWRFVMPAGSAAGGPAGALGPARRTEAEAVEDAAAILVAAYPCGLSYSLSEARFTTSDMTFNWVAKEESPRLMFVGFASPNRGSCRGPTVETDGTVVIRRERKVRCPKGYGWLIRDNYPTVCFKD